jgi:hypothetical protein
VKGDRWLSLSRWGRLAQTFLFTSALGQAPPTASVARVAILRRTTLDSKSMSIERLKRITVEEEKCGGRPCIRRLRIRVSDVLDLLAAGASYEEIHCGADDPQSHTASPHFMR